MMHVPSLERHEGPNPWEAAAHCPTCGQSLAHRTSPAEPRRTRPEPWYFASLVRYARAIEALAACSSVFGLSASAVYLISRLASERLLAALLLALALLVFSGIFVAARMCHALVLLAVDTARRHHHDGSPHPEL